MIYNTFQKKHFKKVITLYFISCEQKLLVHAAWVVELSK